jgi:hypothetical protein
VFLILLIYAYHPTQITIRSEHKRLVKIRSGGVGWDNPQVFAAMSGAIMSDSTTKLVTREQGESQGILRDGKYTGRDRDD